MSQVFAIAFVRFRLLLNSLPKGASRWELLATAGLLLLGLGLSLGLAALMGGLLLGGVSEGELETIKPVLGGSFFIAGCLGILLPTLLSSGASGLDMTQLTLFPIRRRRLFLISWASAFFSTDHGFYYPLLIACYAALASHGLHGGLGGTLAFLLITATIVTWSFAVLSLLQGFMRHRRSKEIASMLAFGIFTLGVMVPSILSRGSDQDKIDPEQWLAWAQQVISWSPPMLATDSILAFGAGQDATGWPKIGMLGLWWLAGILASYAVFSRGLRGDPGGRQNTGRATGPGWLRFDSTRLLPFLPAPVVAIASKELRYAFRSSVGRLNLLILPAVCAFLVTSLGALPKALESEGLAFLNDQPIMLFGLLIYGLLFTTNFVNNCVGWEGVGFKTYLLAPVSFEAVLLGKNLGAWAYSAVLYALIIGSWSILASPPSFGTLYQTLAFFAGSIVLFTSSGNFASIAFPVQRDISSMKSQPSQPALLMSLATVLCLGGALVFVGAVCLRTPYLGLSAGLTLYALGAAFIYRLSLPRAAALFQSKRESILMKIES